MRDKERELQAALDKYADLYDFAPVGFLTLDRQGIIREINLTAAQLLNRPRSQLLGYPLTGLMEQGYSRVLLGSLAGALDNGAEQEVDLRLRSVHPGGVEVLLRMRLQGGGESAVVRVIMLDVTEQRKAQRAARLHLDEAARLQRLQSANELASMLAHELNQPLAVIAMLAETSRRLHEEAASGEGSLQGNLEQIAEMALSAGDIIRRLRQFVSSGRIEPVLLDLNGTVRHACELFGAGAEHSDIRLTLDLCEPAPAVAGVAVQIEQVLLNLLRNARDAIFGAGSKTGYIQVQIRQEGDMARVTVCDSGPGVDAAKAAELFNAYRGDKREGLGVGLHISHSLIEAHGGRLWVEPHVPGGVFHFMLPLAA